MKTPRHAHSALSQSLGELEFNLLQLIWEAPGLDAKQLQGLVEASRKLSLSTIQSTLERLCRKGLIMRTKQGHAYRYSPRLSRGELLGKMLKDVIGLLHDGKVNTILSSFVNVAANIDDDALDELERMIQDRKRRLHIHD